MIRHSQNDGRSVPEVLQDIVINLEDIARSEFLLAKIEVKEEVSRTAKSSTTLIVGVVFAVYALGFALLAGVYALEKILPMWLAALVVGAFAAIIGISLIGAGRSKLQASMQPDKLPHSFAQEEGTKWGNAPNISNSASRPAGTA